MRRPRPATRPERSWGVGDAKAGETADHVEANEIDDSRRQSRWLQASRLDGPPWRRSVVRGALHPGGASVTFSAVLTLPPGQWWPMSRRPGCSVTWKALHWLMSMRRGLLVTAKTQRGAGSQRLARRVRGRLRLSPAGGYASCKASAQGHRDAVAAPCVSCGVDHRCGNRRYATRSSAICPYAQG
jgi:hypothetical protein